jgi:PIN domain nuclease of toxin-antitoxin system
MKLLLDTHALLWSIGKTSELSEQVIAALEDVRNEVLVSAVSFWEIALKHSLGKLSLGAFDIKNIPHYCQKMGFELLPLNPQDAMESADLPKIKNHNDPFDRMLIYQCIRSQYIFVSRDARIKEYKNAGLQYLW